MTLPLGTVADLLRPRTRAEHVRLRLAVTMFALTGALVLNLLHLARLRGELSRTELSNYIAESDPRQTLMLALAVLAALSAGLGYQSLRLGATARHRRLQALWLAGATATQLRRLTTLDGIRAGLVGGLLSGPVYLVLVAVSTQLPMVARLFPGVGRTDAVHWLIVLALTTTLGATLSRGVRTIGWTVTPRDPVRVRAAGPIVLAVVGIVLAILAFTVEQALGGAAAGFLGLALAASCLPWLYRLIGRRLAAFDHPLHVLVGTRLVNGAHAAARMGLVLMLCGFVISTLVRVPVYLLSRPPSDLHASRAFYLTGYGAASAGMLLVGLLGLSALSVAVVDYLTDHRRQLAGLSALGVDARFLGAVVRRQLSVVAGGGLVAGHPGRHGRRA